MNINCLLCGVGGQGTILASRLIASCAIEKGLNVKIAETIGMAQRGGSVVSHVRMGEGIHSPLIPLGMADIIIAMEPGEGVRQLPYLKKGGTAVVSRKAIMPVTSALKEGSYNGDDMISFLESQVENLMIIDVEKLFEGGMNPKALNVILIGAAARSGGLGLSVKELEEAIVRIMPKKYQELNIKALKMG